MSFTSIPMSIDILLRMDLLGLRVSDWSFQRPWMIAVPVLVNNYRPLFRPAVRQLFRIFNCFVSVSPKLHKETTALLPQKPAEMIPCGIVIPPLDRNNRTSIRTGVKITSDDLVLIFVGGIQSRKDPIFLIKNFPAIVRRAPAAKLLLVGPEIEPNYAQQMRSLVNELGLQRHVVFVPQVPDPHPWFQAADIMVFSSLREGFGMVVAEAQANALPVVVRRLPGVNDLFVDHGQTGLFFDDAAGYVGSVLQLAENPTLREEMGNRARCLVQKHFSIVRAAQSYLQVYGLAIQPGTGD